MRVIAAESHGVFRMEGDEPAAAFVLRLANQWGRAQRKQHDFLPGFGADVVMEADNFHAGDFGDHGFHGGACRFDEVGSHLLEQISTFLTRNVS
jgi:hypothetical protein